MHVYVIRSAKAVDELRTQLSKCKEELQEENEFFLRVICSYNKKKTIFETNQTLFFARNSLSSDFITKTGLQISDYCWDNFKFMDPKTENSNLHFKGFSSEFTPQEISNLIREPLSFLLSESDYEISVPIFKRSSGTAKGFGTLTFSDSVDYETRKLTKLLLHNMAVGKDYIFFHWCRNSPPRRVVNMERGIWKQGFVPRILQR